MSGRGAFTHIPTSSGIYLISCAVSNRRYVGQATNIRRRLFQHRGALRQGAHDNPIMQSSWKKHGEESFEYHVLELCAREVLTKQEAHYMESLGSSKLVGGFNINAANDSPGLGLKRPLETCDRMRRAGPARSNAHLITLDGVTDTMSGWARRRGLTVGCLAERLRRGMTPDDAVNSPWVPKGGPYILNGVSKTLNAWCLEYRITRSSVSHRLNSSGWTLQEALTTPVGHSRAA